MPGKEWADELLRLHGQEDGLKRRRYVRLLILLVLSAAIVVAVLVLA